MSILDDDGDGDDDDDDGDDDGDHGDGDDDDGDDDDDVEVSRSDAWGVARSDAPDVSRSDAYAKFRPYIGLIYGRYLRFRFLKWPLMLFDIILQHAQTPAQGQCFEISQTTNPKP